MGWLHEFNAEFHKADGSVDRRLCCDRKLNWDSKDADGNVIATHRVLKSAMVGSTYYAAVRSERKGQEPQVWAAVFLTCGRTKHDGTEWGYKDMDETMGPYEDKCPASILALLTPTDSEYAKAWRERCRKNIAEAAERRKNGPKPLYAPTGVEVEDRKGSWVITSAHYRFYQPYRGVKYTKRAWHDFDAAMKRFLDMYGTREQRAEYAASGRECPAAWKGAAA